MKKFAYGTRIVEAMTKTEAMEKITASTVSDISKELQKLYKEIGVDQKPIVNLIDNEFASVEPIKLPCKYRGLLANLVLRTRVVIGDGTRFKIQVFYGYRTKNDKTEQTIKVIDALFDNKTKKYLEKEINV